MDAWVAARDVNRSLLAVALRFIPSHSRVLMRSRHPSLLAPFVVPSLLVAALASLAGCTGTRLYQRAEEAAAAGNTAMAVSYDQASSWDGRALPEGFDATFRAHTSRFLDERLAKLGPPTADNADEQDAAVRGLLAWGETSTQAALVRERVGAHLGTLAQLRWPRVRALRDQERLDEAVVLSRALLKDATGVDALLAESTALETRARDAHLKDAATAAAYPSAAALYGRLAQQMKAHPTPESTAAEEVLTRHTGMDLTLTTTGANACIAAIGQLGPYLPPKGDTPGHFTFRFTRCQPTYERDSYVDIRTHTETEYRNVPVVDYIRGTSCASVSTGSVTVCDGGSLTDHRDGTTVLTTRCHDEATYGQKCTDTYSPVTHSERVAYTREVQDQVTVYTGEAKIAYAIELEAETGGHHLVLQSSGVARSGGQRSEDKPLLDSALLDLATSQLASQLANAAVQMTRFSQADRAAALTRDADAAQARGEGDQAVALWTEAALLVNQPPAGLVAALNARHVPTPLLTAALANQPWVVTLRAPTPVGLPEVAQAELEEDSREITDAQTLSADKRSAYQGALLLGGQQFQNSTPGLSSSAKGINLSAFGGGASPTNLLPYTCFGGAMHLTGAFDSQLSSLEAGMTLGAGLKFKGLSVLPVGGLMVGTATHSNSDDDDFLPAANIRPSSLDVAWGAQLTLALPYPLKVTLNARLLRTRPVLDGAGVAGGDGDTSPVLSTSRLEGYLGWRFLPELELLVFGRYQEAAAHPGPGVFSFFSGDGHDRQTVSFGVGIGGGYDLPPWGS